MEPPHRLILVPQLPVRMRYSEWWASHFQKELSPGFDQVIVLGSHSPVDPPQGGFCPRDLAIKNECLQISEYLHLSPTKNDTLLHLDISFPGLFHQVLLHTRPGASYAFCHATSLNRYDIFQPVRSFKWRIEKAHIGMYRKVFVATEYHRRKLGLPNVVSLGGLPLPPPEILPEPRRCDRSILFCSVSRPSIQKVDRSVEREIEASTGTPIQRFIFRSWDMYFQFLDRSQFLIITSKEETFGYQVVDAALRGCIPIAPRAYSYPELLPASLLYDPSGTARDRAQRILEIVEAQKKNVGRKVPLICENAMRTFFQRMLEVLR